MPKSFRVDNKLKRIYLNSKVAPDATETVMLDFYGKAGYTIAIKSEHKAKQLRDRHKLNPTPSRKEMEERLKQHKALWQEYKETYAHGKYFVALAWYNKLLSDGKL